MYKLIVHDEAKEELRKEITYSKRKWGNTHARKYSQGLRESIKKLRRNPHLCPVRSDILADIRILTYKGNKIIYTLREDENLVMVLAVLSKFQAIQKSKLKNRSK